MSQALQVLYEQMNFDAVNKLYYSERTLLPFPEDMEAWPAALSAEIRTASQPAYSSQSNYYVLLEFVKRGSKNGYVVLAIPVIVDVPDQSDSGCVYLQPNVAESIALNAEYYLGEHNQTIPQLVLNDSAVLQESFSHSLCAGTAETWFTSACQFLYKSCQVESLQALLQTVQEQLKDQEVRPQLSLVSKPDSGAKNQLLSLYEGLLADGPTAYSDTVLPRLLSVYAGEPIAVDCDTEDMYERYLHTAAHQYDPNMPYLLGHMDTKKASDPSGTLASNRELHPLDNTQRHASLAAAHLDKTYALDKNYGRVLAVNGPPGSGKTSMLKAVVAHYVVKAALLKEPCPIIVASGATNQSVKNVTSAFPDVVQDDDAQYLLQYQRWIPHCPTYGSFYASATAIDDLSEHERSMTPILVAAGLEQPYNFGWLGVGESLNELQNNQKLQEYYVNKAGVFFQQQGRPVPADVEQVVEALHVMLCRTYSAMTHAIEVAQQQLSSPNANLDMVFPVTAPDEHLSALLTIREDLFDLYKHNTLKTYEKLCRERIRDEAIEPADYVRVLRESALNLLIEQCVDLEYRTQLFHLAARYWEGQFILDQATSLHFSRTEDNVLAGLRRICMITPVIISTINRLPSLLKVNSYPTGAMQRSFAYGGIDLLITDESGQATIMGALPLAGLTQRLISVGDVLQLAPVLDTKSEVSVFDEYLIWLRHKYSLAQVTGIFSRQLSVSKSSFLHVVQAASSLNYQGPGYMLRGHYRCYQNIIEYCNQLVYDNKLFYIEHLNKDLKDSGLPAMAYVESTGESTKGDNNASKINRTEAQMIAELVLENYHAWQQLLGDKGHKPPLQDMLAIIMPFNQQKHVMLDALLAENKAQGQPIPEEDIHNTIINTIHALQGAEKDIVIYSGVQTGEDGDKLFFEEQPYLLNVAISRAKKSFIAFLSPNLYRLNDQKMINDPEFKTSNSVHYLGWYMANFGVRLLPNYLFIVEAPGKLKTLRTILKSDYIVHATSGAVTETALGDASLVNATSQLRELPQLAANGERTIEVMLSEGRRVKKIYLATDDDNVGEAIAWHLLQVAKQRAPELVEKIERVALRAITPDAVAEALEQARPIDKAKVSAQLAQEIMDRWLAQSMMQLLASQQSADYAKNTGMGRVKAVILDLIARHEAGIKQQQQNTLQVKVTVNGRQINGQINNVSEDYMERMKAKGAPVNSEGKKYTFIGMRSSELTAEPFNRSTLDVISLAWQRHKILPDATMRILQRLYEGDV